MSWHTGVHPCWKYFCTTPPLKMYSLSVRYLCLFALLSVAFSGSCRQGGNTKKRDLFAVQSDLTDIEAMDTPGNEIEWSDPKCDGVKFGVSLLEVEGHLLLLFDPVTTTDSGSDCDAYLFDSRTIVNTDRQVGVFAHASDALKAALADNDQIYIGDVSIDDIDDAIDAQDDEEDEAYDIVINNCAGRIIRVLELFGFKITSEIRSFCVTSLTKEKKIMDMLRSNSNIGLLYPSLTKNQILAKTDVELMTKLVAYTVSHEDLAHTGSSGSLTVGVLGSLVLLAASLL